MKIAALYARVSSVRQQQHDTITSQVAALLEYAQLHQYHISPQHIFQDEGHSGASLDRPALDRLRDTVAAGEVEAVLLLSPDRLARQFAYQYLITEEFESAGCQVLFLTQGLGKTPAERMLQEMTGVFAEYERAQITERCRRGRLFRARQGQIFLTAAPYGYTFLPKTDSCPAKLVINEAEAEVLRLIVHWLIDDQLSIFQITKRLQEAGIRTRKGKTRWARGSLINLFKNSVYTGTWYYNRRRHVRAQRKNLPLAGPPKRQPSSRQWRPAEEWIAISVPALFDTDIWEVVQRQLQLNRERALRNNKKHDYLLKSLLVCGHCQRRMMGNAGASRRARYRCGHKETSRPMTNPCPGRTVLAETIDSLVWQSVSALLRDPRLLLDHYLMHQQHPDSSLEQQEHQRVERKLKTLAREEQRLIDAYQASIIELSDLKTRCERLAEERTRLEARLVALRQQQHEQQRRAYLRETVEEFCQHIGVALQTPSFATKQQILRLVVDKIVVEDDQITIKHVIPIPDVPLRRYHYVGNTPIRRIGL
jgi:site-specific DNA recombinase